MAFNGNSNSWLIFVFERRRSHVLHRTRYEDLTVGMKLNENDWSALMEQLNATLETFQVPQAERDDVVTFIQSTKTDIVEA